MADNKTPVTNAKGEFVRNGLFHCVKSALFSIVFSVVLVTAFRQWIKDDASAEFPAAANRYHLYVALACPWVSTHPFSHSSLA